MPVISKPQLDFFTEQNGCLAVSSVSSSVAIGSAGDTLLLMNVGATLCYIRQGDSQVVATAGGVVTAAATGGFPVPAGAILQIRALYESTHLAAITDSGTTTLRISRGSGV